MPDRVLDHTAPADPRTDARSAGLRYVNDDRPGITRFGAGTGFCYRDPDGRPIRDKETLRRIASIAIPPAWKQVWICPDPQGHIQATGRDARGRKQYRYHPRWRVVRDSTKFHRMTAFADVLPTIRARLAEDLARRGLPREKALATVVLLIDETLIRVGNEEYARTNHSFGATTLRAEHASVVHGELRLSFRGKAGVEHEYAVHDPRIARVVQRCHHDLPGEHLFGYIDHGGTAHAIGSGDVNDYLHEVGGEEITIKDFRTWGGSVLCHRLLSDAGRADSEREARSMVVATIKVVAARLGNTPAVCRASYIHPLVISAYMDGSLEDDDDIDEVDGLHPDEQRLQAFLLARPEPPE